MPIILSPNLRTALGLCCDIYGTIGGLCVRRQRKSGAVVYWERRKQGALTPGQLAHRARFQRGYEQWGTLTPEQQAAWRTAADRFSTRMVGSHLFLRVWWRQDQHFLAQAFKWHHLTLFLPGP